MPIQATGFADAGGLASHLREDARKAHGIFGLMRTYVDDKPAYLRMIVPVALTWTMDAADHDYDFTAATSAKTIAVILEMRETGGGSPGSYVHIYTKAKAAAGWDHNGGLELTDSTPGQIAINVWTEQYIQRVDSGQAITYNIHRQGTLDVYLVGYFEQGS
jgi:hypothetical protein